MQDLLLQIARHARERPEKSALTDHTCTLTYRELQHVLTEVAANIPNGRVAVMMENSAAWAVIDLAIAACGAVAVPVPAFFTDAQIGHLVTDAAPDVLITDRPDIGIGPWRSRHCETMVVARMELYFHVLEAAHRPALPPDTAKITYTSGTTGQPKGACVTHTAIDEVTRSLASAVAANAEDCSLSVLPLSTLLANIGGIYVPLSQGATALLPSMQYCGFSGSSAVDAQVFIRALHRFSPTATILVPQLLKLIVECVQGGAHLPSTLRFVAVGGAPCSESLIDRARAIGIPAYEGYGLTEATSVVSLNQPGRERPGSVGRPLPHARVRIADDGEIIVSGSLFGGYVGVPGHQPDAWHTGDTGWLDAEGFLHISGRIKTAFATAYGRNVSPEWVESELIATRAIQQGAVFGEGRAFNVAVVVPMPGASAEHVTGAIELANARLPDYARVHAWCAADASFNAGNGLARPSGALDRQAIAERYGTAIDALYDQEAQHAHP